MKNQQKTPRRPAFMIILGLMLAMIMGVPGTASATGGYPDSDAVSCGSSAWCKNGSWYSDRGYAYRNCTDYLAWKLQSLGVPDSKTRGLGNGGEWAANAAGRAGVTVNTTPAYGAAAVMPSSSGNPYGHVAFVESVNSNGTITISEYNYGWNGNHHTRTATAASMGFTQFVHFGVSSTQPMPVNSSIVFTNGSGGTWANANPSMNAWTKLSNTTNAISASGSYTAWIDGCGAAWATSNFATVAATKITNCNGATAIAIGSQGNLVFVDSCGSAHASNTFTNPQSWVVLTGCNGTTAVAAGGGGRVAVINNCGALNVTTNYQSWTQIAPCDGAQKVALGPNGTLAFTNGCGALNATTNYTSSSAWVSITGCGGARQFAVGTDKRLVFADGCGSAHGTMTYDIPSSWVTLTGCGGTQALAMGTGGQTGVINGCGALNVTATFQNWTQIAPCNGATRVTIS